MDEEYTDTGTIVPPDHFAIIIARDGETQMLVPKALAEGNEEVPIPWVAGSMAAIKFMRDPEWVEEMAEEFMSRRKS